MPPAVTNEHKTYDKVLLYEIAFRSLSDWRTVRKYLDGHPVRELTGIRIGAVCSELGVTVPKREAVR